MKFLLITLLGTSLIHPAWATTEIGTLTWKEFARKEKTSSQDCHAAADLIEKEFSIASLGIQFKAACIIPPSGAANSTRTPELRITMDLSSPQSSTRVLEAKVLDLPAWMGEKPSAWVEKKVLPLANDTYAVSDSKLVRIPTWMQPQDKWVALFGGGSTPKNIDAQFDRKFARLLPKDGVILFFKGWRDDLEARYVRLISK